MRSYALVVLAGSLTLGSSWSFAEPSKAPWDSPLLPGDPGPTQRIAGTVTHSNARWGPQARTIVTEATVTDANGKITVIRQLGGTVSGIGMKTFPAPPILRTGQAVDVEIELQNTTSATPVWQAKKVLVTEDSGPIPVEETGNRNYARTVNNSGAELFWSSGCVFLTYDVSGSRQIQGGREFTEIEAVVDTWIGETDSCSYLRFETKKSEEEMNVGLDGINLIKFREDNWCAPSGDCYDRAAAGLTTLFFVDDPDSKRNGEILDADIELNGIHFAISVDGNSEGSGCQSDLGNTLTHELGHLMGLDHTCFAGGGVRPKDGNGELVPNCSPNSTLPASIRESTMYNFQECGETKKSTLEDTDISGICAIYPVANDPKRCTEVDIGTEESFCAATPSDSPLHERLPTFLLVAIAGVLVLRGTRPQLQ